MLSCFRSYHYRSNGRQASLLEVKKALRKRYIGDFLSGRYVLNYIYIIYLFFRFLWECFLTFWRYNCVGWYKDWSFNFRVDTLIDILEKLMKRGNQLDRVLASEICSLFCLQVGDEESTKLFYALKSTLLSLISDETISPMERAAVRK